jgi:PAS domain S-box-containing protein
MTSKPAILTAIASSATHNKLASTAWKPMLALVSFTLVITLASYIVFHEYKDKIKADKQEELASIAESKAKRISTWLDERRNDALALKNDPFFTAELERWLQQGGADNSAKRLLRERLDSVQKASAIYGVTAASLVDTKGMLRLYSSLEKDPVTERAYRHVFESMQSGKLLFSDLHMEESENEKFPEIDLSVPLRRVKMGKEYTIGAVIIHIDPRVFLFPLIQRWPTSSPSAESVLFRKDADGVTYLNELRHIKNVPLKMHLPSTQTRLLSNQALAGKTGLLEGVDYRNVEAVGVANPIPDTTWYLISKIDKAELYAPVNSLSNWMTILMLTLVAGGCGITLFWLEKEKRYFKGEIERHALGKHLDYLAKYANDIILLHDSSGNIIEFNDRAVEAYGYSAKELTGMSMSILHAANFSTSFAESQQKIASHKSIRFESSHVRKNGETFPVEVSVRCFELGDEVYFQSIIRDISDRKLIETELENERIHMQTLVQVMPDLVWLKNKEGLYLNCNRQIELFFGKTEAEIVGKSDYDFVGKELADAFRANDLKAMQAKSSVSNEEWLTFSGKDYSGWFETVKSPMYDHHGELLGVIGIARDITNRKNSANELLQQKLFLHQVVDTDPNMIYVKNADGSLALVNKALADLFAMDTQQMVDVFNADRNRFDNWHSTFLLSDLERSEETFRHIESTVTPQGTRRWFLLIKQPIQQQDGTFRELGIAVNITDQKLSEMKMLASYNELQRLTAHMETVREEERIKIARELHDEMGALLAALKMRVAWLATRLSPEQTVLKEETDFINGLVKDGIQTVRDIVGKLRPSLLEDLGLDAAIEEFVRQFRLNTNIECKLSLPEGGLLVSAEQGVAILRILQESFSNIIKHAEATQVEVSIICRHDLFTMQVSDNGLGFSNPQNNKSFGLIGIRERALMVGGDAKISSRSGKGTVVSVSIPLENTVQNILESL